MSPLPFLAFPLEVDSSSVLVQRDQCRSQPAFAAWNLPLFVSLTRRHSLFRLSHTCNRVGSSHDLLSSCEDGYRFSTFRLITTDGLGSAFSPVAHHLRRKRFEFPVLATHHFGHSLISIFGCLSITKFIGSSLSLTIPSYSSGLIRRDAGRSSALSQRLCTLSLPTTHTLVESDWENNR